MHIAADHSSGDRRLPLPRGSNWYPSPLQPFLACSATMCGEQRYMMFIAGLWVETIFYGLFVALFSQSVYILVWKRPNKYFLATSITMFSLCTAFIVTQFLSVLLTPAVTAGSNCVGGACVACGPNTQARLNQVLITQLLEPISDALVAATLLVADGVLIYRCVVVWHGRPWVAILPTLLLLTNIGLECAISAGDAEIYQIRHDAPLSQAGPPARWFAISALQGRLELVHPIMSLATNVVTTTLIATRIWWIGRQIERDMGNKKGRYGYVVALIIESGAIYSLSLFIFLLMYFIAPDYSGIPNGAAVQLMGIAPTLIIVRIGMGKGIEDTHMSSLHDESIAETHTMRFAENSNLRKRSSAPDGAYIDAVKAAAYEMEDLAASFRQSRSSSTLDI